MVERKVSRMDYISNLSDSITDSILTKLPIRDAVRTSLLSTEWRYRWATMTQLVFNDKLYHTELPTWDAVRTGGDLSTMMRYARAAASLYDNEPVSSGMHGVTAAEKFVNFVLRFLLLHDGPVEKCEIFTSNLKSCADMEQWLLVLSRKDVKELVLGDSRKKTPLFHAPSHIFSCHQLTSLKLFLFKLKSIPLKFEGFPCLKCLSLEVRKISLEIIEKLISGCPLLEKFEFSTVKKIYFTIRVPNLKYLMLGGNFKHVDLLPPPLLTAMTISFSPQVWDDEIGKKIPFTFDGLKFINIERMNHVSSELVYALHLLLQSPNLEILHISAAAVSSCGTIQAAAFGFWEEECPVDFTFKHLRVVKMSEICSRHDVEFLKFVLGHSPVLEMLSVSPNSDEKELELGKMKMVNQVLRLPRASPKVVINFFD